MARVTAYGTGGCDPQKPVANRVAEWDDVAGTYTRWAADGVVAETRAITATERASFDVSGVGPDLPTLARQFTARDDDMAPLLIKHGQDIPTAGQIAGNAALFRGLPFDGLVVRSTTLGGIVFSGTASTQADYATALTALPADMGRVKHNFWRITLGTSAVMTWTDDALWTTIASNVRNLAAAMAASGRPWVGIFLDTEWYGTAPSPFDYGTGSTAWTFSATEGALPNMQPADARTLVRQRGQQILDAARQGWAQVKILTTFGPWVAEPATATAMTTGGVPYTNIAFANELMGSFITGIATAAAGTTAQWIDGSEFYRPRSLAQFRSVTSWVKEGFAASGTVLLNAADLLPYRAGVTTALPVYDLDPGNAFAAHPAADLGALVNMAMRTTDRYCWLYTEKYEWSATASGKTPVPQAYLDAVAAARSSARNWRLYGRP